MTISDEQIQDLLRVGNPTDEECRLIRMGWDAAFARMRTTAVPDDIVREVLRDCCGTFHGSRHRITCEKYKGKRDQETSCEDE